MLIPATYNRPLSAKVAMFLAACTRYGC